MSRDWLQVETVIENVMPEVKVTEEKVTAANKRLGDVRLQFTENERDVSRADKETDSAKRVTDALGEVHDLV